MSAAQVGYLPRLIDPLIESLSTRAPALLLTGPRAAGKTTTALHHSVDTVRLDRPAEAAAFRADPDAALSARRTPLLVDEWQQVPEVLGALKRAVDADPAAGRFIVTGSVRSELDHALWPGTGRLIRVPVWPLVRREIDGDPGSADAAWVVDGIVQHGLEVLKEPSSPPDLLGYLELAVAGGLPPAALTDDLAYRRRWFRSYAEQLVTSDAQELGERDPVRLRRYLDVLAENSAGMPTVATLLDAAGINARTASSYDRLLQALGVLDVVRGWSHARVKRIVQRGKRYLTDTGLCAALLGVDAAELIRDGDLFGRMIDTFVAAQLRPYLSISELAPQMFHLRSDSHEVDLLLDFGRRGVLAVEVKATGAPKRSDAAHLFWLRDQLPRFAGGIVLHTGPRLIRFDRDVVAAPIACLWQ